MTNGAAMIVRRLRVLAAFLALCLLLAAPALAADVKGAKDHPLLKRFAGSEIVVYTAKTYDRYTLPTGPLQEWNFDAKKPVFASSQDLAGKLTRLTYRVPEGASAAEVFENYKGELADKGFTILYEAEGQAFGEMQGELYGGIGTQLLQYSPDAAHFLSAELDRPEGAVHVALYVTEYQDGYTKVEVAKGQPLVQLDVIESKPLEQKMVVVSASEIAEALDTAGRISLYGILFDFNKASIKAESRPALDEIAKYLKSQPAARLYVVGHTDSVGGFDANMQLSRARAEAVVAALTGDYGIARGRLMPQGVGLLAPVASNASEEGRAKNRRVELVPQ